CDSWLRARSCRLSRSGASRTLHPRARNWTPAHRLCSSTPDLSTAVRPARATWGADWRALVDQRPTAGQSETSPKATMIAPDSRLITVIAFAPTRLRNQPAEKLRKSHHAAEPRKTPSTITPALA